MQDSLIGHVLGDYEITELLGRGGMARVYRGYDKKLDRYAAVKVIDLDATTKDLQEEFKLRFLREARAIAHLQHPNIVGVYQFDQIGDASFMAMHFIEGKDLRQILQDYHDRGEKMSIADVFNVISDIASALDYAHKRNVIHRDVKPSNIMIRTDGTAILTDFGLVLNVPEGTFGTTFGSARYMAPEQAFSSANAVPQSDFYSLGIVLYEMITGQVPFDDPTTMAVALKHINELPPAPSTINRDISPALEDVILRMLRKKPEERYPDGKTMLNALRAALKSTAEARESNSMAESPAARQVSRPVKARPDKVSDTGTGDRATAHPPGDSGATALLPAHPRRQGGWRLLPLTLLFVLLVGGAWLATQAGLIDLSAPGVLPSKASPQAVSPTATPVDAGVRPELLLIYDGNSLLVTNQSDKILDLTPLEFRRTDPGAAASVPFRIETLTEGVEPPDALHPGHCFQIRRSSLSTDPGVDPAACAALVGWKPVPPEQWFWVDNARDATFEVWGFGYPIPTCTVAAGRCEIDLPYH